MPPLSFAMDFGNGGLLGTSSHHVRSKRRDAAAASYYDSNNSTIKTRASKNKTKRGDRTARSSQEITTTPHTKAVRFNPSVKVRKVSTHRRYTPEERGNVWYFKEEMQTIRSEAMATIKKMMKRIRVDDDPNDCSRGLEFKTPKTNKIRQARKTDIIWTVLAEHDCHVGKLNRDEIVADVYISCSRPCIAEAARRGAMDAVEAWGFI